LSQTTTTAEALATNDTLPCVQELHTRFMFPFMFRRDSVTAAVSALERATVAGRADVWKVSDPPALYLDELTRHIRGFLFPKAGTIPSAAYLRVSAERLQQLLPKGFVVVLEDLDRARRLNSAASGESNAKLPEVVTVSVLHGPGIELFLSDQGAGVLCISLSTGALHVAAALEFNYRLAVIRRDAAYFYVPHPRDVPEIWKRIPPAQRETMPMPTPATADSGQRIGAIGATFTLNELRHELLKPLESLGHAADDDAVFQKQLSLFTVGRFDSTIDLVEASSADWARGFMAGLAQVEEPWHAGAAPGRLPVRNCMLNRSHWAAAGLYAAAHLVADQKSPRADFAEHPFNSSRVPRVRDKYFVPYLAAEMQTLVLHRALADTGRILGAGRRESAKRLGELRRRLLEFTLRGQFDQVSHRHAVQRFYRMVRRAFALDGTWRELRHVVAELDSRNVADRQERMQHAAHFIEMAVASVYFAHLMYMIEESSGEVIKTYPIARVALVAAAAVFGLAFAFVVSWLTDRHDTPLHSVDRATESVPTGS